jgi:hypothetical protein
VRNESRAQWHRFRPAFPVLVRRPDSRPGAIGFGDPIFIRDLAMTADVDVLIIGAGASGAAFAWSIADTRMRILCLEQGDWMNPADYPSTRRDWPALI